jgi:hypothetical protein
MIRFYILAGDHRQAQALADTMRLAPNEWRYIISSQSILGLRNEVILAFGTWQAKKDLDEIMDIARVREMTILYIHDGRELNSRPMR